MRSIAPPPAQGLVAGILRSLNSILEEIPSETGGIEPDHGRHEHPPIRVPHRGHRVQEGQQDQPDAPPDVYDAGIPPDALDAPQGGHQHGRDNPPVQHEGQWIERHIALITLRPWLGELVMEVFAMAGLSW